MAGGENARRKSEKIKKIYDSLESMEKKLDYLLELDMRSMATQGVGKKYSDQEWDAYQDAKKQFLKQYIQEADIDTQKQVYAYMGKLFTQNDMELYLGTKENLESLPQKMENRDKAAYWLARNASQNGMKIVALKELAQEFDSTMIEIPKLREEVIKLSGFNENTTMEQYARLQGLSKPDDIQNYLEETGKKANDKAMDYLNEVGVSQTDVKDMLVKSETQKWLRQAQSDYLRSMDPKGEHTDELKQGIEDINKKNKEDLSDRGIEEWLEKEGKQKAKEFDLDFYVTFEKGFREKYFLPYEKQEWKDLEHAELRERNARYQEESRIAACSFRENLEFGEAKEDILKLRDSAEATLDFLRDQKVLKGFSNAQEGLKKEDWVNRSMNGLLTANYADLLKKAGMQGSDAVLIDGKSPKELWGDKYKGVEDPALKEKCFQVEILKRIAEGKSEIGIKTIGIEANGTVKAMGSVTALPRTADIRDLMHSHAVYRSGMKSMANELKEIQTQLLGTHGVKDLNKARKEIGKVGTEYFQDMERTLNDAIKAMEDERVTPEQVEKKLAAYKKAADKYAKERDSIFGKHSNKGTVRLSAAKKGGLVSLQILANHKNLKKSLPSKVLFDQDSTFADLKPSEAGKGLTEAFASKTWKDIYGLEEMNLSDKECQNYVEKIREVSNAQASMENMMKKGAESLGRTQEKVNGVTSTANPNALDAAIAYHQGMLRKQYYKEGISANNVKVMEKELEKKIKDGSFKADADKLSKNPVFKATVKENPGQFSKEWHRIEKQTDAAIGFMKNSLEELTSDHPDLSKYVVFGNETGSMTKSTVDQKYARLGDIVTKQVLTDPAGRTVVQAIEAGRMEYGDVVKTITEELKKKEILNPGKLSYDELREQIHNGKLKNLMTENVGKQAAKSITERATTKKSASTQPKDRKIGK